MIRNIIGRLMGKRSCQYMPDSVTMADVIMFRQSSQQSAARAAADAQAHSPGRYLMPGLAPATAGADAFALCGLCTATVGLSIANVVPSSDLLEVLDFSDESGQWLGLKVLRVEKGRQADEQGTVEFIARLQDRRQGAALARSQSVYNAMATGGLISMEGTIDVPQCPGRYFRFTMLAIPTQAVV